ncbi:MAG: M15 family metallopeptidase, partial [Acidimicrobiales bacterium]
IITGQQIRTKVSAVERANLDRWFATLTGSSAPASPNPRAAPEPAAKTAPERVAQPAVDCAGLGGVSAELASRTCAAIRSSGGDCHVISGFRSYARQAELYQRYLNGTGNLAAPPGSSNHETGDAVDMSGGCAAELAAQDLVTPVGDEPWHWELP